MKFSSITYIVVFFLSILLLTACSKKDSDPSPGPGAILVDPSEGFLCTIGKNSVGKKDTLVWRPGLFYLTDYEYYSFANGFLKKPRDIIYMSRSGKNNWLFKTNQNKYFGFREDQFYVPGSQIHPYQYYLTLSDTLSAASEFVATKVGEKFYIEPVELKGHYLTPIPTTLPLSPTLNMIFLKDTKNEFFFQSN